MEEENEFLERFEIISLIVGAALFVAAFIFGQHSAVGRILFFASFLPLGWELVRGAIHHLRRGVIFDENLLMLIAACGAVAIGELPEAAAVMLFYRIGEWFQERAAGSSRRSIAALMDIRPDTANLLRDGDIVVVPPREVEVGELILVKPGERVPLDGVVTDGASALDTSALTGESLPRDIAVGDDALSGCVNLTGAVTVRVTTPFGESTVERILALVEDASSKKARAEHFITKFARVYTPVVVGLAVLIAILPPLLGGAELAVWVRRALILLVISCPCALVVSIPLAFFGGIGASSRRGILVKGGNYLDALCALDAVAFDKTGTLTRGQFGVTGVFPEEGFTREALLELAAHAESLSTHPIARSLTDAYGGDIDNAIVSRYREIAGYGVEAAVRGITVLAGSAALLLKIEIEVAAPDGADAVVYIAADGVYAGYITVADSIRPDSRGAIEKLERLGIRTVMLTGDNAAAAASVAAELGIREFYAGLLPQDKVEAVENMSNSFGRLCFIGDGINDAPVLARADIGVAMGGLGSDAAAQSADIVLMTDEPSKLCDAIEIARYTRKIVTQNIVLALGVKLAALILGVFGLIGMWVAVFADVGVALLAVLNSARVVRRFR
jgi:Cd2+/Zn2+-exporting ATPase